MKPRNIFWIMTDEQRADSVHGYGADYGAAPYLSSPAVRGVRFSQAITPSPMCVPARTSQLSGSLPAQTGVWRNRRGPADTAPRADASLLRWLRSEGYATVSVGKQHYALSSQAFQTEEAIVLSDLVGYTSYKGGRSHTDYDGVRFPGPTQWIMAGTFPGTIEETAEWRVVERALEILDSHDQAEPLLLRLSFNAPHTPVTPPRAYLEEIPADVPPPPAFGHREARRPRWLELLQTKYADAGLLNDEELGRMRRHYLAWCRFVDDMIARFATALEARGLLADSVFAFCADHGAHLGDHGLVQKQSFFTESVTVPYIFAAPGVAPGRIDKPVSTMTLLPTAAGLAGVTVPDEFRHLDLSRELLDKRPASEARPPEPAPASSGSQVNSAWGVDNPRAVISQSRLNPAMLEWDNRIVMVQEDNLRGVFDIDAPDDTELLYDLAVDPHELASCANNPSYAEDLERLRNLARQAAQPHSSR